MENSEIYRQVARLHAGNINQGFLPTLGERFLALMYRAIDSGKGGVLLVEERDGCIIGFVAGASGMGKVYRGMLRHPFELAWALLPSLFKPQRVTRIFEVWRYARNSEPEAYLPVTELLSIAVDSPYRGQHIAESLYKRLLEYFSDGGASAFKITVGESLEDAHRFYRRMGAVPVAEVEVHRGQPSTVYIHDITSPSMD